MTQKFDLIVIGTGTAASTVAHQCRSAGWQVAVIDSRPFGGTCALRGCDPKKVLVGAAEAIDWVRRMKSTGALAGDACIDWPALMRFKRSFTDPVPKSREKSFREAGIAAFHGRARFTGSNTVEVNGEILEGRFAVIAAGAKPVRLGITGEEHLTTSEQFLDLDKLPERIVFVGGGYISMEFAHVAARAGAKVTILHRGEHILPNFDPDLGEQLTGKTREIGIDVRLETVVEKIKKVNGRIRVHASRKGKDMAIETDLVVHGAGRVPEIDDLNLDAAGVESGKKGVKVNEYLQSASNPTVYAAGDASGSPGPPLTPVAGYEGRMVAANLLEGNHAKVNYQVVPTVVYTTPPFGAVGLSEKAAREQNLKFKTNHANTADWYSSRRIGETCSGYKVLIEESRERILGAHLLGPHAEEIINIFALAIRTGVKASELKEMIFSYPTNSSDIQYML